jgi:hypothetical protein
MRFYVARGFAVATSFGRKYVDSPLRRVPSSWRSTARRALAKDAGVSPDDAGSHRLMIGSSAGSFTDPDGFAWDAAPL